MSLKMILSSFPNGFHDAKLYEISANFSGHSVDFLLDVWVGNQNTTDVEKYKSIKLTVSDLFFLQVESPNFNYPYLKFDFLTIGAGIGIAPNSEFKAPSELRLEDIMWIYVSNWNSFIHVAGKSFSIRNI